MGELRAPDAKLGTSFHRTFSLSRDMLRQVLVAAADRGAVDDDTLRECTTLGTVQVQAARRYAIGTALLDAREQITPFGSLVQQHDPGLSHPTTAWLLHYHLAARHRAGPAFWGRIVTTRFRPGAEFTVSEIADLIVDEDSDERGRVVAPATRRSTATVFLGSYTKSDALGNLGILSAEGGEFYHVEEPPCPAVNLFAYVLADFWNGVWGGLPMVNLSDVTGESGPGPLLLLSAGTINRLLREMQDLGYLRLQRRVPPYGVFRGWPDASVLLERIYVP